MTGDEPTEQRAAVTIPVAPKPRAEMFGPPRKLFDEDTMPNHLTTVCTVTGPEASIYEFRTFAIRDTESGDGKFFDLGQVIPKPPVVDETQSGSETETGFYALTGMVQTRFFMFGGKLPIEWYLKSNPPFTPQPLDTFETFAVWLSEHHPDVLDKGRKSLQCFRETGHVSWYEWCRANWGTKWNSYDFEERSSEPGKYVFEFQTANGMPEPVFRRLVEIYPDLTFETVTIDEGGPEFEGTFAVGAPCDCVKKEHNLERYRLVYGRDPYSDDDDDEDSDSN